MRNLFYIIIAVILLPSCSNSKVVISEADLPEDIFYLNDEIKPYTGKAIIYYDGTELVKEELSYKAGVLDGVATSYYKNGRIRRKGTYNNGRLSGKWECWFENGRKQYEVAYQNDTLSGDYISWYSSGVIKSRGSFKGNARAGLWVEYDEAGMLMKKKDYE